MAIPQGFAQVCDAWTFVDGDHLETYSGRVFAKTDENLAATPVLQQVSGQFRRDDGHPPGPRFVETCAAGGRNALSARVRDLAGLRDTNSNQVTSTGQLLFAFLGQL
jgi:hypothetical protein